MNKMLLSVAAAVAATFSIAHTAAADDPAGVEFFEKKVRPVLANNCYNCHSAFNNSMGGLRVDDRNGLIQGGSRGPAVVPGDPEKSRLILAIRQTGDLKMPPKKKLSDEEIADLTKWVADGAAWPEPKLPASVAATGKLVRTRPAASPAKDFKVIELRNNGPEARGLAEQARSSVHRSVYLPLFRGLAPRSLEVFDSVEQGTVTGSRSTTTVAPQALYLLNDPFVRQQSQILAERLFQRTDLDDAGRIHWAYRLALGRTPTTNEIARASSYLSDYEGGYRQVLAAAQAAKPAATAEVAASGESAGSGAAGEAAKANQPAEKAKETAAPQGQEPVKKEAVPKKPEPVAAVAANPDDPVPAADVPEEQPIQPNNPRIVAWASFCQALIGSAEFRYLK